MDYIRLEKRTIQERLIIAKTLIETALSDLPTADLSEYCDKLWKAAYERGKARAYPKKGKWIQDWRDERGYTHISGYKCSECGALYPWGTNYCPNCGADMREEQNDSV